MQPYYRIRSDGRTGRTEVFDADGRKLFGVTKVVRSADAKEPLAKCVVELVGVAVDVQGAGETG